jgi:hypothetical protein
MAQPICSNGQARNGFALSISQYGIRETSPCIAETVEYISVIVMGSEESSAIPRAYGPSDGTMPKQREQ